MVLLIILYYWEIILLTGSNHGRFILIKEIYSFGGAQAIASLAYIQKVNKILGPGNRFVAEAKRQLSGKVIGTESMFAGPSEICVLADKDTNIDQVATSLISQAEHDTDSQCILITKDEGLIKKVKIKMVTCPFWC